jgi:hypothetical protein
LLGRKNILANLVSYPILIVLLLWTIGLAGAQTPIRSSDKSRMGLRPTELEPSSISTKAPAASTETEPAKAEVVNSEANQMNAAADAAKSRRMTLAEPLPAPAPAQCKRMISADVVALSQPIMLNRLGAAIPDGLVFALKRDTVVTGNQVQLRTGKRPRPLVLRANVGDCLTITFTNSVPKSRFQITPPPPAPVLPLNTSEISLHVQGMEWVAGASDDGSFVGKNDSSLASVASPPDTAQPAQPAQPAQTQKYTLYAKEEGTFLLYTMGDTSSFGDQLRHGLFGALNVQPAGAEWYRSQVTADDLARATYNANRLGRSTLSCATSSDCTLTITSQISKRVKVLKTAGGYLNTLDNHPLINYDATYADGTPILKLLDVNNNIVHSDLTAIITGPNAGRFPGAAGVNNPEPPCNAENSPILKKGKVDPLFCANPAAPDRKQPYREITVIYHGALGPITQQAFPVFTDQDLKNTLTAGQDAFAINYGTGGIGAEVYANRIGVGPMGDCVDCKFEEFFLSAWSVGDPAMLVDRPANSNNITVQSKFLPPCNTTAAFNQPPCGGTRSNTGFPYTMRPEVKATAAFFPDDPSNVYHSYINDHVKFRILHGGADVTHVHHTSGFNHRTATSQAIWIVR